MTADNSRHSHSPSANEDSPIAHTATAANQWVNTAAPDQHTHGQLVHQILQHNRFCTLATCSTDGLPWASPLLYGYDDQLRLYWSSAIAARHSDYITQNQGRSAITIYDSTAQPGNIAGLFLSGTAQMVPESETQQAMARLFARVTPRPDRTAADYLGASPRRFYQFQPAAIWLTGERLKVGEQLVDTKIQLNLQAITQHLATLN